MNIGSIFSVATLRHTWWHLLLALFLSSGFLLMIASIGSLLTSSNTIHNASSHVHNIAVVHNDTTNMQHVTMTPDSGATHFICNQRSAFSTLDFSGPRAKFNIAGPKPIVSTAVGDIPFRMYDIDNQEMHTEVLHDVHYIPQQPFNLMSVRRMIRENGFKSPDFDSLTWSKWDADARKMRRFSFREKRGAYSWQSLAFPAAAAVTLSDTTCTVSQLEHQSYFSHNKTSAELLANVMNTPNDCFEVTMTYF